MATSHASPVKPSVIRWAVGEDGRGPADLADALKITPTLLEDWLTGERSPTKGQISSLARVLHRPRALFLLPQPPTSAALPPSFRHPPGDDQRNVSAEVRRQVRRARRIQNAVAWARRDQGAVDVPRARPDEAPGAAAARARAWLGIDDDEQGSWSTDMEGLRAWRGALQERGVLVFVLQLGRDEVRGFSAWDDRAPLIVANSSAINPSARSFTLAHELAHLVTRTDSACLEPSDTYVAQGTETERWCESFGASLLMSEWAMTAFGRERGIGQRAADVEDVRAAKRRFQVSARAAALRLIDLGLATPLLYGAVRQAFPPAQPPPRGTPIASPPRWEKRLREYGPQTVQTVLDALPPRDALSVLRITVEDVRKIADEVPGVREV